MILFPDRTERRAIQVRVRRRPPRPAPVGLIATLPFLVVAGLLGCSQSPDARPLPESVRRAAEVERPERPMPPPPSQPAEEEEGGDGEGPEAASEENEGSTGKKDEGSTVVMIDRGEGGRKPSLWEAAQAERERRRTARPPVASVTNENLHEYQDAELIFAEPKVGKEKPSEPAGSGEGGGGSETEAVGDEDTDSGDPEVEQDEEEYWRSRVLDIRLELRDTVDEIDELEREAASLRRSFYAEDDPYVRDGRIKPAWDRARDRLRVARREVGRLRGELEETLEEGRRAGALPGWLREGIDVEPSFEEDEPARTEGGLPIYEPEEPETVPEDEASDEPPELP